MLLTILVVILVLALLGGLPTWPWMSGRSYGYYPSGILGTILLIVLVLWLLGAL